MGQGTIPSRDKIFLFSTASRPAPGNAQLPIQWVLAVISLALKKQQRHEADHTPPSSAKVKNGGAITAIPLCLHGMVLN
jgi:hypothetical protein